MKIKKVLASIGLSFVALLLATMPVLAAYSALIQVITTTTAYDMLSTNTAMDNTLLVDNNFIDEDGRDVQMQEAGINVPRMLADDKTLFADGMPSGSTNNYYYVTDETPADFAILEGYDGYVTTSDDEPLEWVSNGEVEIDGYIDTTDSNYTFPAQKRDSNSIAITDTTEISGIVYFDEPVDVSPETLLAWTDIDISSYVPEYASGAVVHLYTSNAPEEIGVRMNGVALDARGDIDTHIWTMVGIDASDIFEGYVETATCFIYLVGFTGSGVTYKAVPDDISLVPVGAWTDIDLSIEAPGAVGVIVAVDETTNVQSLYGLRMNGSADARTGAIQADGWYYGIIGCDATQIIEGHINAINVDFYLVGYITEDFDFNLNGTDKSLAAGFGAWTDIDCAGDVPAGTTHIIFELDANNQVAGFRRNGSTENIASIVQGLCWVVVECDSDYIVEHWAANLNVDIYITGYTQGYIDSPYADQVIADSLVSGEYVVNHSLNANQYDFSDYDTYTTVAVSMGGGLIPVVLLEEQELTAAAASVTFSNIDTLVSGWDIIGGVTSRHLVVVVNAASADAVAQRDLYLTFNGDTGNNYNEQELTGVAAAAAAARQTGVARLTVFPFPGTTYASSFGGGTILIPAAFLTTNHKAVLSYGGAVEDEVKELAGRWASINAITSATLTSSSGNIATGSTFWLGVVDERYLVEEDLLAADGLPVFDTIPQDGSDLCIIGSIRTDRAATNDIVIQELNNDNVIASYFRQWLRGLGGGTAAESANNNHIAITIGDTAVANAFGAFYASYSQYAEGANIPHYLALSGFHDSTPDGYVWALSGRWNVVNAITKIEYFPNTGANFKASSLFSLYRVPRTVIDRQELTAPAATITFTDIPQGYEVLQLNVYGRSSDAIPIEDDVNISFNNDVVAANYDTQILSGTLAVVAAARSAADLTLMKVPAAGEGANEFGGGIVTIPNYAKADRHKHYYSVDGTNENQVVIRSMRWEDTDPITEIDLTLASAANFVAGTIAELVGIFPQDVHAIEIDGDLYGISDGNNLEVPDVDLDRSYNFKNSLPYANSIEQSGAAPHFTGGATSNINAGVIHDSETELWVSQWFTPDYDYTSVAPTDQYLWGKQADANNNILAWLDTTGVISFRLETLGVERFSIDSVETSWNRGQPYHVIYSISSTAGVRMIVNNGVAVTDADTTALFTGGDFCFGDFDDPGAGTGFIGKQYNISIGDDDLTTAEELGLYNGIIPSDANNIWYCDEGTGVNIIDYGTDGNDGTADAAVTWVGSGGMGNENALKRLWYQPDDIIVSTSFDGTADAGGTATTLVDAALTQVDDYWNHALLTMITGATAGETSIVADFDAATDTLYFEALSAVVGVGDTYTVDFGTLPDRATGANEAGRITWGVNPADISYTIGSMVSSDITLPATIETTEDVIPTGFAGDLWGMAAPVNAYSDIVNSVAVAADLPAVIVWVTICLFLVLVTMIALYVKFQNTTLAGLIGAFMIIVFMMMGIIPKWALLLVVLLVLLPGLVRSER